ANRPCPRHRRRRPLLSPASAQGLPRLGLGRLRPRPARDRLSAPDRAALCGGPGPPGACRVPARSMALPTLLRARRLGAGPAGPGKSSQLAAAVALLVPAVSNGMGAPLNDVALAAFGNAALFAWTRWLDRPTRANAALAGV